MRVIPGIQNQNKGSRGPVDQTKQSFQNLKSCKIKRSRLLQKAYVMFNKTLLSISLALYVHKAKATAV